MFRTKSIPSSAGMKRRDRFGRFPIVLAILLAGWFPSILMPVISYRTLSNTLESKILHDRQTFVQLVAHLVGDDLSRTGSVIQYYQTQPEVVKMLSGPNAENAAQQWLALTFYSHARIDGMFIAAPDGRLIASLPAIPASDTQDTSSVLWREGAAGSADVFVSPVHPRLPDNRMTTDIVGAVRTPEGAIVGYLGVSVLVERIGRRLSSIDFHGANCQVIDQSGMALFTNNFVPNMGSAAPQPSGLYEEIRQGKTGHLERNGNLYSFTTIDTTGWMTVVDEPRAVAYKPVRDLFSKLIFPAAWLIILTAIGAWLAGKFTRRQAEAARRIEREVIFNEKILANMPSGIALVDPDSRNFLQANEAFSEMAKRFGALPQEKDIHDATYDEVKIAPADAIERVLAFGAPFQLVEQPFTDQRRHDALRERQSAPASGFRAAHSGRALSGGRQDARRYPAPGADWRERGQGPVSRPAFARTAKSAFARHRHGGRAGGERAGFARCAPRARGHSSQRRVGGAIDRRSPRRHPHLKGQAPAQLRDRERARNLAARLRNLP